MHDAYVGHKTGQRHGVDLPLLEQLVEGCAGKCAVAALVDEEMLPRLNMIPAIKLKHHYECRAYAAGWSGSAMSEY